MWEMKERGESDGQAPDAPSKRESGRRGDVVRTRLGFRGSAASRVLQTTSKRGS